MNRSTLGSTIRSLRLEHQLTQAALAEKLHITDKAVSKWERDLSCPDISLFPKLAELLDVTVDDLLKTLPFDGQSSKLMKTYDLSQDIRTPIHVILGCAELAELHADDRQQLERYLSSIRVSAEYLLKTISRILPSIQKSAGTDRTPGENLEAYLKALSAGSVSEMQKIFSGFDFTGKRFLLAEDLEVNREIVVEILKQTGAQTDCAENGSICLSMLESSPAGTYDLVLMDIIMPVMNGIDAARKIRQMQDPQKSGIPIIALTANVDAKDREAAFAAGMNAFAEKPLDLGGLFSAIQQCLEKN